MSAWRQPLFWLVLALPLAAVAAGIVTFRLAAAGPDASDGAGVRRTAQTQVEDLAADLAAARAGLSATLMADRASGMLVLELPVGVAPANLLLRHPADAARDHALVPVFDGTRWTARVDAPFAGAWRVELHGGNGAWRIDGRLARDASTARLVPRVAVPRA